MAARSPEVPPEAPRSVTPSYLQWLLLSSVAVFVLTLCAVHAPSRIKLLGLFAVAYGLLAGWGTGQLARISGIHSRRIVAIVSFGVIIAGQVGMALESHRLFAAELRRQYQADPIAALLKQLPFPQQPKDQAKLKETIEQNRRERARRLAELTSFSAYLQHRVKSLSWSQPWAVLLWAVEVLLASAAGAFLAGRVASGDVPKWTVTNHSAKLD